MDWASIIGLTMALMGVIIGQWIEGGTLGSLLQPTAFFVVIFGTVGAVLLQNRLPVFIQGIKMTRQIFKQAPDNQRILVRDLTYWSTVARREGMLSLEKHLSSIRDPFIAKGLRMVIDGFSSLQIRETLETQIALYEHEHRMAAKIWESAGGYAPTMGILGAVLGLIQVMSHLTVPNKLGSGIAIAFVATVCGIGLANLLFLPISNKLKVLVDVEVRKREMVMEAFCSIAAGDNARAIEERISTYLPTT